MELLALLICTVIPSTIFFGLGYFYAHYKRGWLKVQFGQPEQESEQNE